MSFILMLALVINILFINLLPVEYNIIILVCAFLYFCIFGYLSFKNNSKTITRVILSIMLLFSIYINFSGLIYYYVTYNAISSISDVDYELVNYSIYGLDNTVLEIGVVEDINLDIIDMVEDDYDVEIKYYNDYTLLIEDYNMGLIDSFLINDSYYSLYEINSSTKIKTYTIKEDISLDTDVDVINETFNIYLSGIDSSSSVLTRTRSDVNMVISVNIKTREILLIHIPRDYYVDIPSIGYDKINHAGVIGINESILVVEELLDEEIDYYAKVNFNTIVELVDAIGGINVYSDYAFGDIKVGDNYIDGETTLSFVRKRNSLPGGDRQRGINQQEVISSIIEKISSSDTLLNNYLGIIDSIDELVKTNMSSEEIFLIVNNQLSDMSGYTINTYNLDGSDVLEYSSLLGFDEWMMIRDEDTVKEGISLLNDMNKEGE